MRSTRTSPRELARSVSKEARDLAGKIRKMIVSRAGASARWQVTGHDLAPIGGEEETRDAETFAGVGFAARPDSSSDTEAIVVFPGEASGGPIIIGTRQEASRRVVALDLAADETQIHGAIGEGGTIVRIKADGTVEIRTTGGTAVPLATKADLEAVVTYLKKQFSAAAGHVHATPSGPTTAITEGSTTADGGAPAPSGTSVLKAE